MADKPSVSTIHQVLPWLHTADAAGAHTLHARSALREAGYVSEIFVEHVDPPLADEVLPYEYLDQNLDKGRTVLLYQLAVGSVLVDRLLRRREPIFVNYHNLTPADFFWKWAPDWLNAVESGRQDLHRLAPKVSHAIAVSAFNQRDLQASGYMSTSVVPPFVDVASFPVQAPREGSDGLRPARRGARWIFVGKLLPHKAAHDLLKALAVYRRVYDPDATLVLVGGQPVPAYAEAVTAYSRALGLADAVDIAGPVSHERLAAEYSGSDVFVCVSDHEGFCFPLLEAMHQRLPVVAVDAAAVGDTLGDAGILLTDKRPEVVAAAVRLVLTDDELRRRLLEAGRRRLADFDLARTKLEFAGQVHAAIEHL
ncbi:MAG: glycosyltransferase family 4 protein [Acidimicrobiales bacterium]